MQAGYKERNRYKDCSWLMPSIDLDTMLEKLNIVIDPKTSTHKVLRGYCPDHHLYTGKEPSNADWVLNTETGETFCFTESRGSNLVWTTCRLLKCEPDDAALILTGREAGSDISDLAFSAFKARANRLTRSSENVRKDPIQGLESIVKDAATPSMSEMAYQFFIHPPGKKYPTNITRETVDRYKVFERTWGFYEGRVVIPYFMRGVVVGFCAIDLKGKQAWIDEHPALPEKDYRKVRYPKNFDSTECLFGFDDVPKDADSLIVTEGAREVMKLTQEGFNAVAILGSHLSLKHRQLIGELHPKSIVLMFDGDDPGVAITTKVSSSMGEIFPGDRLIKCFLPRGRDPKVLNRNELLALIKNSQKRLTRKA